MKIPQYTHYTSPLRSYSPLVGTTQVGHRALSGEISSSGDRIHLRAWALVYPLCSVADGNYDLFAKVFSDVNSNGLISLPVDGITGSSFINLGERQDIIGERATIWMTSASNRTDEHGAVLVAVVDNMVHLLTLDPYLGVAYERPIYLIEDIIHRVEERVAELKFSPTADTMGHLPVVQDIGDLLANTRLEASWYRVTPT